MTMEYINVPIVALYIGWCVFNLCIYPRFRMNRRNM